MNKKLLFYLFLFIGILTSCSKESQLEDQTVKDKSNESLSFTVIDGILSFESSAGFFALGEKLSAMTPEQQSSWEQEFGFVSLRSEIEVAFDNLEKCETITEYTSVLNKNSDIILTQDNTAIPSIKGLFYPNIINREGYYMVGKTLHKVTSKGVYATDNKSFEDIEKAILKGTSTENKEILFTASSNTCNLKSTSGATSVWAGSAWRNDKKCHVTIQLVEAVEGFDPVTFKYYVYCVSASVGKGLFGGEIYYQSVHYTEGYEVRFDAPSYLNANGYGGPKIEYFTQTNSHVPEGPSSEIKNNYWWSSLSVGNPITMSRAIYNQIGSPKTTIEYASGTFYTRGSYPNLATIRFGY